MSRILVVGSLVMDTVGTTHRFPQKGETIIGEDFVTATGGKGANQATQASLLGADVTMLGKVGNDAFGRELVSAAKAVGIDTTTIFVDEKKPTGVAQIQIEISETGTDNRILVVPGANMAIRTEDLDCLADIIPTVDMVMLQLEIPMEINVAVAKMAKQNGVPVMLNSAPYSALPAALLENLTYISPNEHEAGEMVGSGIVSVDDAYTACEKIIAMGVENVIITLGSKGAVFANKELRIFSPAVENVKVADPTAAGDSFVGAFCYAICNGYPVEKALRFANCTAAITVSKMGAQPSLPTIDEVMGAYGDLI